MENTNNKGIFERVYDWFTLKGLLGSILLAFVIILILLSVSFVPGIMSKISSSLSAALYSVFIPAENATITTDKIIINSGEDFTVNFKKTESIPGIFTISYACNPNVSLVSVEGSGLRKIDCDKPFYLLENETFLKIRPTTADNVVRLVIEGAFENSDTQKTDKIGVTRITIKNNSIGVIADQPVTTTSTTTKASTYIAPVVQPAYYGKPDLAIRVLQVGLLNQYTNLINSQTQFNYSDMVGVKFEVRNDGDANTGQWSFTASLPSNSTPTYTSNIQVSLKPGESIIFTLGFNNLTNTYTGLITINVDPQNIVSESVEYNNIVTQSITNTGYNNYNNYGYNNTGCYINGVFTYNCSNNNNWNYNYNNGYYDSYGNYINYNNYYNNLGVTCHASPSNPETGDRVRWYADAYGGDDNYDYEWVGTNSLDSSAQNPSKTYSSRGWKYATVTVESDGYTVSQTCSVYVN